jgi:dimethylhistidine N-methyltransferase
MSAELNVRLSTDLHILRPAEHEFCNDVLAGLAMSPKRIPSKYLYDRRGSRLFDAICDLPEYYLTRTELEITQRFAGEMAAQIGPRAMLIELGSGSSVKTRIMLNHLHSPVVYVPVDISQDHLLQTAAELAVAYPQLQILPVHGDFTRELQLPGPDRQETGRTVYFPGSTIGNFTADESKSVLGRIGTLCGIGGGLLVGIDLQKDVSTIEAAYNDNQGITAEFNLNLLRRINRELGANFDLRSFHHLAFYDPSHCRIDIRLISDRNQIVCVAGSQFRFAKGEPIHTEYSHKFTVDGFASLAERAGFTLRRDWTDKKRFFALLYLIRAK